MLMKIDLNKEIQKIYDLLIDSKEVRGDWAIIQPKISKKIRNKVTIININNIINNEFNEKILFVESKKEYYYIKYSGKFISLISAENEYGLAIAPPIQVYAVNLEAISKPNEPNKAYTPKEILKTIGFKLSKKAIKDLDDFT